MDNTTDARTRLTGFCPFACFTQSAPFLALPKSRYAVMGRHTVKVLP